MAQPKGMNMTSAVNDDGYVVLSTSIYQLFGYPTVDYFEQVGDAQALLRYLFAGYDPIPSTCASRVVCATASLFTLSGEILELKVTNHVYDLCRRHQGVTQKQVHQLWPGSRQTQA
ncbi:unnamed protein product [Caenorhabditis bovis]|uniref:Uncharacterized protein n=1 Tax=Caenorhabditis bovis TaxID=2654633 RepID=A0A8S1EFG0_9PELO|nr:unnamed protein product [Caenorhabditis bovis]